MFLRALHLFGLSFALTLTACTADTVGPSDGGGTPREDGGADPRADAEPLPDASGGFPRSEKARVRFKRQRALASDLGRALDLAPEAICAEVGRFDCFTVHQIPLGGVEPYVLGINEPVENTTVTTPIAVERIVLSACRQRVDLDLAPGTVAAIFGGLPVGANGAIDDIEDAAVRRAIDDLYKRLLLRTATDAEAAHLVGLYADVTAAAEPAPARAWAILSCFAVATSVESLFY